jgi:glycerophosphoryl diester phosphodiesterase
VTLLNKLDKKKGKKWLVLYGILIINFILIELILLMLQSYWGDINLYISEFIGFNINLVFIAMFIVALPLIYGLLLIYRGLKKFSRTNELKPHIINKILPIFLILLFDAVVVLLVNVLEEYSKIIFQILEFYSIFIYLGIWICLISILYPIMKHIPKLNNHLSKRFLKPKVKTKLISIFILIGYIFAAILPFLTNLANVMNYEIPNKPTIIGHRGGAQVGPENTIETAEYAMNFGIVGWEVDIAVSYDGIPFILHDDTLRRTTNVEDIFPNRKNDRADSFNITELRQLDAGSWFVEKDPFGTIESGIITQEQAEKYKGVRISTFEEVLNFTRDNNLYLDFDTRGPPNGHPYHDDYKEILLNMTIDSGIDLSKIMIYFSSWLNLIKNRSVSEIWDARDYHNTGDGYTNEEYRDFYRRGFPIMVYIINSFERFSQLWCLGAKWVKTDTPYLFANLNNPFWALRVEHYFLIWSAIYIVGVSIFIFILYKTHNKEGLKRE